MFLYCDHMLVSNRCKILLLYEKYCRLVGKYVLKQQNKVSVLCAFDNSLD